jgi:importin-9
MLIMGKNVGQLVSWTHPDGQSSLVHVPTIIARLLQSQDESGGLVIGDLMILFSDAPESVCFPFCRTSHEPFSCACRPHKRRPSFKASVIPFAFLIYSLGDAMLDLLESKRVGDARRSGLDVLLNS